MSFENFKRAGLATASLVAAMTAGASALAEEPPVSNPAVLLRDFDAQSVGAVLSELGVIWQASETEGQPYIAASAGGEVSFILVPAACRGENHTGCVGLSMVAIYDGGADARTIQAFNYRYAFASAGLDPSGDAYLKRYEISDYGIARGNLATSILVFLEQAQMLRNELSTARRTVAQEGYADDLAASLLNRGGVEALTGRRAHMAGAIEAHRVGLDESALHVKRLINNPRAPRNKINNIDN